MVPGLLGAVVASVLPDVLGSGCLHACSSSFPGSLECICRAKMLVVPAAASRTAACLNGAVAPATAFLPLGGAVTAPTLTSTVAILIRPANKAMGPAASGRDAAHRSPSLLLALFALLIVGSCIFSPFGTDLGLQPSAPSCAQAATPPNPYVALCLSVKGEPMIGADGLAALMLQPPPLRRRRLCRTAVCTARSLWCLLECSNCCTAAGCGSSCGVWFIIVRFVRIARLPPAPCPTRMPAPCPLPAQTSGRSCRSGWSTI